MRLILIDRPLPKRINFYPLALCRPIWELRCGMTTLGQKLVAKLATRNVACFLPPYLAEVYRMQTAWPVNDAASLAGDDLMIVAGHVKASELAIAPAGPSQVVLDADGEVLVARINQADLPGRRPRVRGARTRSTPCWHGPRRLPAAAAAADQRTWCRPPGTTPGT